MAFVTKDPEEKNLWLQHINQRLFQLPQLGDEVPSKKIIVFINPFGGQGKAQKIWEEVRVMFFAANFTYEEIVTERSGFAEEYVQEFDWHQYDGIICVSGDGLLNEVINGIMKRNDWLELVQKVPFGMIPGGSGNALIATLGGITPATAAFFIIKGKTCTLDLFSIVQNDIRKYGFLLVEWAVGSVIDFDSENLRFLG